MDGRDFVRLLTICLLNYFTQINIQYGSIDLFKIEIWRNVQLFKLKLETSFYPVFMEIKYFLKYCKP